MNSRFCLVSYSGFMIFLISACNVEYALPAPGDIDWEAPVHEHSFADDPSQRATLRSQAIMRMEPRDAPEAHPKNSNRPGWDCIPFHVSDDTTFRLSLGPCAIGHAFLAPGRPLAVPLCAVKPGNAVEVAVVRPAEFVILEFVWEMADSG